MKNVISSHIKQAPTLFIIRGASGAGKSTLAKQISNWFAAEHFEADMYFMKEGTYRFDPSKLKDAHTWCRNAVKAALSEGKNVVVANTFCQDEHLMPYLEMTDSPIIIQVNTQYSNVHSVPEYVVARMRSGLATTKIKPTILIN